MTGRLASYARWQLRDYVFERGVATLLVGFLLGYVSWLSVQGLLAADWRSSPEAPLAARRALAVMAGGMPLLLVLVNTNGVVANDLRYGYFRLLFAKPVSVPRYYAQLFVVNGVGMVAASAVLLALFAALVWPVFPPGALAGMALVYLGLGGLAFLLSSVVSSVWRYDWLSLVAVVGAAELLRARFPDASGPLAWLIALLPPTQLMDGVLTALITGSALAPWHVVWMGGYGLACFALGLLVLRYRSLAS